jgi:hypothetical protein
LFRTVRCLLRHLISLVRLGLTSRAQLAAENLFLRKQVTLYQERRTKPRRPDPATRVTLVLLSRWLDWRSLLTVVQPDTLIRWHRRGWRLFWRWKSCVGRPPIPIDLQRLIMTMARATGSRVITTPVLNGLHHEYHLIREAMTSKTAARFFWTTGNVPLPRAGGALLSALPAVSRDCCFDVKRVEAGTPVEEPDPFATRTNSMRRTLWTSKWFRASDVSSGWEKPPQGAPAKRPRISPTRILGNRLLSSGSTCAGAGSRSALPLRFSVIFEYGGLIP